MYRNSFEHAAHLKTFFVMFFAVMMLAGPAYCWTEWNYTGSSHLWSNAANWSPHVPLSTEDPIIRGQGVGNYALIDSTVAAVGNLMWVGFSGRADLDITGGSLTLRSGLRIGQSAAGSGNVNLGGGTVKVVGDMVVGDAGTAVLNITNGTFNHLSGWLYLGYNGGTGTINLDGGILSTYKLVMGSGHPRFNLTNGKLIITNLDSAGVSAEIDGYIQAGQFTIFGGDPRAAYKYTVNSSGYTEVTASLPNAQYAWNPNPPSLSAGVSPAVALTWSAGTGASSHDVYLGTDRTAVASAAMLRADLNGDGPVDLDDLAIMLRQWLVAPGVPVDLLGDITDDNTVNLVDFSAMAKDMNTSVPEFMGNQTSTTYNADLQPGTYYWRVDEVIAGVRYKGPVWSFTTGSIITEPSTDTIDKYDVLNINIGTSAAWSNPYDSDDIRLDAVITTPAGANMVVPGFYMAGHSGNSQWQCRFSPRQVGTYSYHLDFYQASALIASSPTFTLVANDSTKDGFVGKNASSFYTFIFDSGKRFRGIGENIGWEQGGYMYDRLFPLLHTMGCNYVRVWLSNPYNQPLEGTQGIGKYDQTIAARMDNTIALARANDIYLTISFNGAGELDPNPADTTTGWPKNPYNISNGGMCSAPTDFFTSASAKAQYKKKLRYIVARWGSSSNIAAFELWNEIDGAWKLYNVPSSYVVSWHNEMSSYLKSIDPYQHLLTTSCTAFDTNPSVWGLSNIDFSQTHPYRNQDTANYDPGHFYALITGYESKYGKPHVLGEFGYTSNEPALETHDNMVGNLHSGLWYGMFSPTPILPQTWWWDYFERNNDEIHLSAASAFLGQMMARNVDIVSRSATMSNTNINAMAVRTGIDQFVFLRNNSGITQTSGMTLTLTGMINGSYTVNFYNTSTGEWYNVQTAAVSGEKLILAIPSMSDFQDLAIWVAPDF